MARDLTIHKAKVPGLGFKPQSACIESPIGWANRRAGGHVTLPGPARRKAHRVAWEDHHQRPIPAGMFILHRYDNPPCIRADHLLLGTARDNAVDRMLKNRGGDRSGEKNGRAKLTWAIVRDVRAQAKAGKVNRMKMGRELGVTATAILKIIKGETWQEQA